MRVALVGGGGNDHTILDFLRGLRRKKCASPLGKKTQAGTRDRPHIPTWTQNPRSTVTQEWEQKISYLASRSGSEGIRIG